MRGMERRRLRERKVVGWGLWGVILWVHKFYGGLRTVALSDHNSVLFLIVI
jgi:hypothetical protein